MAEFEAFPDLQDWVWNDAAKVVYILIGTAALDGGIAGVDGLEVNDIAYLRDGPRLKATGKCATLVRNIGSDLLSALAQRTFVLDISPGVAKLEPTLVALKVDQPHVANV